MQSNDVKEQIKSIIKTELSFLMERILRDFKVNYKKKVSNWTLADFDSTIIAHMVFVSSYESKSGNMFQRIATNVAKIKYGEENVPMVIKGRGVSDQEFKDFQQSYNGQAQIVISKVSLRDCQGFISNFREQNKAQGSGRNRIEPTINQTTINKINKEDFRMIDGINTKPIDLIFFNSEDKTYYMMEIKAGGGLDSSNAPANVSKMLTEYALLGKQNAKLFFSTLYNFNGEGNVWTGQVKKYLSNEMLLIGKDFWKIVLPKEISFEEFEKIYHNVTKELGVNEKITNLIKEVED